VRVRETLASALVVRTSAFFGPWDDYNFLTIALRELGAGRPFLALEDAVVTPTYVPELVHASLDLLTDGAEGVWHLANGGALSWYELARRCVELAGLDQTLVVGQPLGVAGLAARRPRYAALGTARGRLLGSVEHALRHYLGARGIAPVEQDQRHAPESADVAATARTERPVERTIARLADALPDRPRGTAPHDRPPEHEDALGRIA
jgi:hypothetical protein